MEGEGREREADPDPFCVTVDGLGEVGAVGGFSPVYDGPVFVLVLVYRNETVQISINSMMIRKERTPRSSSKSTLLRL